jgi:N-methylhydantoinase A
VIRDLSRTILTRAEDVSDTGLNDIFDHMTQWGTEELAGEGIDSRGIHVLKSLDMRYEGQSYEINVPLTGDPAGTFHDAHEKLYGYSRRNSGAEIVTLRLRLIVVVGKPAPQYAQQAAQTKPPRPVATRTIIYGGKEASARIYDREELTQGSVLEGPALIGESSSTTFLPPENQAMVDALGNIMITIG